MGGRTLSWQKGTGGSWRIVYVDDVFDFGCYWSVSGAGAFLRWHTAGEKETFRNGIFMSFTAIGGLSIVLTILLYGFVRPLIFCGAGGNGRGYGNVSHICIAGFFATFCITIFASVLRSIGNSVLPLVFLGISVALNIGLDLLFVVTFSFGDLSPSTQPVSVLCFIFFSGIPICALRKRFYMEEKRTSGRFFLCPDLRVCKESVMNFWHLDDTGISQLLWHNDYGALFLSRSKLDTIAYMPVQDFGNAFSFFVAQNYGAKKYVRIRKGFLPALVSVLIFCLVISAVVFGFADSLMGFFYKRGQCRISRRRRISPGRRGFPFDWGMFFVLLYGYYRAVDKPVVSVVLTIISLGTR